MSTLQPVTVSDVVVRVCGRTRNGKRCEAEFIVGSGMVPDVATLYGQERDGKIDEACPLVRVEILTHEMCISCSRDYRFHNAAITMHPTQTILGMMARWAENNARALDRERLRQERAGSDRRQQERRQGDRRGQSFVADTIGKLAKDSVQRANRPKKGRKYDNTPKAKFVPTPENPKNFGQYQKAAPKPVKKEKDKKKRGKQ
jgi:hypothetical protein